MCPAGCRHSELLHIEAEGCRAAGCGCIYGLVPGIEADERCAGTAGRRCEYIALYESLCHVHAGDARKERCRQRAIEAERLLRAERESRAEQRARAREAQERLEAEQWRKRREALDRERAEQRRHVKAAVDRKAPLASSAHQSWRQVIRILLAWVGASLVVALIGAAADAHQQREARDRALCAATVQKSVDKLSGLPPIDVSSMDPSYYQLVYQARRTIAGAAADIVLDMPRCFDAYDTVAAGAVRSLPTALTSVELPHPPRCADGWLSPSIGRRGACSHHGGVSYGVYEPTLHCFCDAGWPISRYQHSIFADFFSMNLVP